MLKEYKTVLKQSVAETEEKKSRFIASVKPVKTEDEALEFINGLKSKYWDASHNVYSYYVGGNNIVQRFSDAGEPSGTAGLPILEVIKRMEVQDLVVVVTRYFGGTLLGAAGLIRAYSKSASLGIEAAVVVKRLQCRTISLIVEYTMFG
ncbi:MAG TPA: YigZ family protein, partial [Clostridia bacterium]|nr:YigZ family protein [Clostridia bacterium]